MSNEFTFAFLSHLALFGHIYPEGLPLDRLHEERSRHRETQVDTGQLIRSSKVHKTAQGNKKKKSRGAPHIETPSPIQRHRARQATDNPIL